MLCSIVLTPKFEPFFHGDPISSFSARLSLVFCCLILSSTSFANVKCSQIWATDLSTALMPKNAIFFSERFYDALTEIEHAISEASGEPFRFVGSKTLNLNDYEQLAEIVYDKITEFYESSPSNNNPLDTFFGSPKSEITEYLETALISLSLVTIVPTRSEKITLKSKLSDNFGDTYTDMTLYTSMGLIVLGTLSSGISIPLSMAGFPDAYSITEPFAKGTVFLGFASALSTASIPIIKRFEKRRVKREEERLKSHNNKMLNSLWNLGLNVKEKLDFDKPTFDYQNVTDLMQEPEANTQDYR